MQLGLFDIPAAITDEGVATVAAREACELSFRFLQACEVAGVNYRGYHIVCGARVYFYSPLGSPDDLREMPISRWDRTPASLRGVA